MGPGGSSEADEDEYNVLPGDCWARWRLSVCVCVCDLGFFLWVLPWWNRGHMLVSTIITVTAAAPTFVHHSTVHTHRTNWADVRSPQKLCEKHSYESEFCPCLLCLKLCFFVSATFKNHKIKIKDCLKCMQLSCMIYCFLAFQNQK